eukprot:COSAG04_NODE_1103_length_8239_cov_138.727518_2_plen_928_part_00
MLCFRTGTPSSKTRKRERAFESRLIPMHGLIEDAQRSTSQAARRARAEPRGLRSGAEPARAEPALLSHEQQAELLRSHERPPAARMQGPLAKQNPAAPQLYSVRTFVLDEAAQILRFSGSADAGADAPREHYILLRDVESLEQGEDARDFELRQVRGPPLSLRARSRAESFEWLLRLSEESRVEVSLHPSTGERSGPLPAGWEQLQCATGQPYFRNAATEQRQWFRPRSGPRGDAADTPATPACLDAELDPAAGQEGEADATAAEEVRRRDVAILQLKEARRRRRWGADPPAAEEGEVYAHAAHPSEGSGDASAGVQPPELSKRGLELQAGIDELLSRREARRERRRSRKADVWHRTAPSDAGAAAAPAAAPAAKTLPATPPRGDPALSSEDQVASQMVRLLHAAFPTEDARDRVYSQIVGQQNSATDAPTGGVGSSSHPPAPVPTSSEGTYVAPAIVDRPTMPVQPGGLGFATTAAARGQSEALRAELQLLRPSELRRRALSEGVSAAQLSEAQDSAEPKRQIISLLLHHAQSERQAATTVTPPAVGLEPELAALQLELEGTRPSELRRRALASGVSPLSLDEAQDSTRPKEAIIKLLLEQRRERSASEHKLQYATSAVLTQAHDEVVAAQAEAAKARQEAEISAAATAAAALQASDLQITLQSEKQAMAELRSEAAAAAAAAETARAEARVQAEELVSAERQTEALESESRSRLAAEKAAMASQLAEARAEAAAAAEASKSYKEQAARELAAERAEREARERETDAAQAALREAQRKAESAPLPALEPGQKLNAEAKTTPGVPEAPTSLPDPTLPPPQLPAPPPPPTGTDSATAGSATTQPLTAVEKLKLRRQAKAAAAAQGSAVVQTSASPEAGDTPPAPPAPPAPDANTESAKPRAKASPPPGLTTTELLLCASHTLDPSAVH